MTNNLTNSTNGTDQENNVYSQTISYSYTVLFRERDNVNSKWSSWRPYVNNEIRCSSTDTMQVKTIIVINKNQINLNGRQNAGLRLYFTFSNPPRDQRHIFINGTKIAINRKYNYILPYIGEISINDTGNLEVEIEYCDYVFADLKPKNRIYFCKSTAPSTSGEFKKFSMPGNTELNLDVHSGKYFYSFTDIEEGSLIPGFGIKHNFTQNTEDNNCGEFFKLNIQEHLKTEALKTNDLVKSHIYTDAYGELHTFNVKFYYFDIFGKQNYITDLYNIVGPRLPSASDFTGDTVKDFTYSGYPVHYVQITVNNQINLEEPSDSTKNNSYYNTLLSQQNKDKLPV